MNPLNVATTSSPPPPLPAANELQARRKRGRPRRDETLTQQENSHVTPKPDTNLVGKMVSGVVEGSFDAGFILNVKVKDSDTKLRGVVFLPEKITPITPENDVAPNAKMIAREEIKNVTEDQSQSLPNDQPMKDAADLEIAESAQILSLMAHESNGETFTVQEKDGAMETEEVVDKTRLVEFLPTPETRMMTADQPTAQKESPEEKQKSPGEKEEACSGEKVVAEELQLELGNKTIMSGGDGDKGNESMETDAKISESKSGFIDNLFEGEDKNVNCDMDDDAEEEATPSVH